MQTNDILKIYDQLLSAAAGETSFSKVIGTMTEAYGAAGGVVFELNRKTGAITNWISPTLKTGEDDYSQHINSINPRMRYSMRHAPGHIVYEHKFIDDASMGKNEFYDWLDREHGMGYFLGSRLYDEGDISVFHSIEFSKKHGHPDKATVDIFKNTSRALGNAWLSANRVVTPALTNQLKAWTPDHLPWSIFALSSTGKVLEMNSSARALIESSDMFTVWDGVLVPSHQSSLTAFQEGITTAINGESFDMLLLGGKNNTRFIAKLVPINTLELSAPLPIAVLLYVWDPVKKGRNIDKSLRVLWGLTHAEATLALRLSNGDSLTSAAEKLGISRNTARNQLQRIFAKTNTKRQSELAAHVCGVIDYN